MAYCIMTYYNDICYAIRFNDCIMTFFIDYFKHPSPVLKTFIRTFFKAYYTMLFCNVLYQRSVKVTVGTYVAQSHFVIDLWSYHLVCVKAISELHNDVTSTA